MKVGLWRKLSAEDFWTVVLEKTLESPLDCKEIQPVHPTGNHWNIHWKNWCWTWNSSSWATKITEDGDCSHEIKRHLFLGRKPMTNLNNILKSRDIILPTKVHLVKAMVMYGCESWTLKKADCQRIDAFERWCWRRLWESLQLQGHQTRIFRKSVLNIHWKDWCWSWSSNILTT